MGNASSDLSRMNAEAAFRAEVEIYFMTDPRIQFASGDRTRVSRLDGLVKASMNADCQKSLADHLAVGWAAIELGVMLDPRAPKTSERYFNQARNALGSILAQDPANYLTDTGETGAFFTATRSLSAFELIRPLSAKQQRAVAKKQYGTLDQVLQLGESLDVSKPDIMQQSRERSKKGVVAEAAVAAMASRAGYLVAPSSARQRFSMSLRKPKANWDISVWKIQEERMVSFATPPDVRLGVKNNFVVNPEDYDARIVPVSVMGDIFPNFNTRQVAMFAMHAEVRNDGSYSEKGLRYPTEELKAGQAALVDIIEYAISNPALPTKGSFDNDNRHRHTTPFIQRRVKRRR